MPTNHAPPIVLQPKEVLAVERRIATIRLRSRTKRPPSTAHRDLAGQDYYLVRRCCRRCLPKKENEKQLVQMILHSGKKKDEQLNELMSQIEEEEAREREGGGK